MKIWIVYTQWCDDPSVIHGIFDSEEKARKAVADAAYQDRKIMDWQEFEVNNKYSKEGVVLS